MAKLALSAVGYAYIASPEHARHEFVARIPQNEFQSTVGEVGLNHKSDECSLVSYRPLARKYSSDAEPAPLAKSIIA